MSRGVFPNPGRSGVNIPKLVSSGPINGTRNSPMSGFRLPDRERKERQGCCSHCAPSLLLSHPDHSSFQVLLISEPSSRVNLFTNLTPSGRSSSSAVPGCRCTTLHTFLLLLQGPPHHVMTREYRREWTEWTAFSHAHGPCRSAGKSGCPVHRPLASFPLTLVGNFCAEHPWYHPRDGRTMA